MDVAPRPERVLALRDLLGLSLQELGAAAGLSQGYLSDIANGNRPFTEQHVEALAHGLHFPPEFFYVQAPAVERDSLNFRKLKKAPAKLTRKAEQYFREASRVTQYAAEVAGLKTKRLPFIYSDEGPLLNEEIERTAEALRDLMGLADLDPVPNLTRAIERLGIVVAPVSLDPTGDEVAPVTTFEGHFGISHGDEVGVPVVGYFPGSSADRDRFTLGHEVGHVLLHSRRKSSDPEKEANRFAGALLISEQAARSTLHSMVTLNQLARIKSKFGISIQALIMRAAGLGIIDEKRQRSLFVQLSGRGWRQVEPVEIEPENPLLLRKIIDIAVADNAAPSTLERTLALPAGYIRSMAPLPPRRGAVRRQPVPLVRSSRGL